MSRIVALAVAGGLAASTIGWSIGTWSAPLTGDTPEARRATAALNILEARGYCADIAQKSATGFDKFAPQAGGFAAQVTENGHTYTMSVNPDTGNVTATH